MIIWKKQYNTVLRKRPDCVIMQSGYSFVSTGFIQPFPIHVWVQMKHKQSLFVKYGLG